MNNPAVQYVVLAVCLLALVLIWFWRSSGPREPRPEELAAAALNPQLSEPDREKAAVRLASHPDKPLPLIRRVFSEAQSVQVRAAAALGLGALMDWPSMPKLIEAMKGDSVELRRHANAAVVQIMGRDFGFRADDPEPERKKIIATIERNYPVYQKIYYNKNNLAQPVPEAQP